MMTVTRYRSFPQYPNNSIYDELIGPRNGAFGLEDRFGCRADGRPEDQCIEGMKKEWPARSQVGVTELPNKPTLGGCPRVPA